VNIYPNPASDHINLSFSSTKEELVNLTIHDIMGRLVYNNTEAVTLGTNQIQVDLHQFETGLYIIQINSGTNNYVSEKITKN
jgi:hypothetical protein